MGNEFFGFSPEAFEQFVRALSLCVFGPGVKAFGNGPDGGREASFQGEVPYPYPPTTQWAGYGVIQAKCKEKPESTDKDQKWALKQLAHELDTFTTSNNRDPMPEYYVFVTNVELSSTTGGGRDSADSLIKSYYGKLPLKGHDVWDANQLAAFAATYPELRKRFAAYLTPGDVLAAMLVNMERRRRNASCSLTTFVERELRADESSRLDQAGNRREEQLPLARLFFDLPASKDQQLVPPNEKLDECGRLPPGVLRELLAEGARKLDPKTVFEQETSATDTPTELFPTRYVLLGGPGSGKSTIGQILSQIHRAALLERGAQHLLDAQTRRIIAETRTLCSRDGLPWPATPRYPFRVELNRFAKALASKDSDHVQSLGGYLLKMLKRECTLDHEDLLDWLATYPWLLVLDGLDEVPATSNREAVVGAVNDFLAEARLAEADLFIVATSRQQGYGGEFATGGVVAFRHIMPLSTARALRYIEQYAQARFGPNDPNRAKDLIDKLQDSAKRDLTAQLMSSPLQVTFMATVVAARGDPGEDRWQLFASYYQTIYDRERQKAVPPYDVILSKHKPAIDRLHHEVGFLLQHQGETASNHAATLPIHRFERLVDQYLTESGREGDEKALLVLQIREAAQGRLVFLASRVEGQLSFDVRSLQEYMAAECLMTGDPELVKARLRAIAPFPYWRNVYLFAAGKCFGDAQSRHLQDTIRLLSDDFNNSDDRLLSATRAGSEIALDVLQSGAVAENPAHARHLARIALDLLVEPYLLDESEAGSADGASADYRLASVYRAPLLEAYRKHLELHVGQADAARTLGTWPLLLRLVEKDVPWAMQLADARWPSDSEARLKVLEHVLPELRQVNWLMEKARDAVIDVPPTRCRRIVLQTHLGGLPELLMTLGLVPAGFKPRTMNISFPMCAENPDAIHFRMTTAFPSHNEEREYYTAVSKLPCRCVGWLPLILVHQFVINPSRQTLCDVLRKCIEGGWTPAKPSLSNIVEHLPWPVAGCLSAVETTEQLSRLTQQIDAGALGDVADWRAAEERWRSKGVTPEDITLTANGFQPFDSTIGHRGMPLIDNLGMSITVTEYPDTLLRELASLAERLPPHARRPILWLLCRAGARTGSMVDCMEPTRFRALLESMEFPLGWYENIIGYPKQPEVVDKWLDFFEWLGRSRALSTRYRVRASYDDLWRETWATAFVTNPDRLGILRLLGRAASAGQDIEEIPHRLLKLANFSDVSDKVAALVVRLTQADVAESEAACLAESAAGLIDSATGPEVVELIIRTAETHLDKTPAVEWFLLRLHEKMPAGARSGLAECERLLRRVVQRRPSGLQGQTRLEKLQLPVLASEP